MQMKDLPLFYAPDLRETLALPEGEAQHALRSLRTQVGDTLLVTDGRGMLYEVEVTGVDRRNCFVHITHQEAWPKYWHGQWTVALAPTKNIDRIEWTIEKMVEVGVDRIILLRTKHSERKHTNIERLERILQSAMKQSHKALLPELLPAMSMEEALTSQAGDVKLIAHCREGLQPERQLIHQVWRPESNITLFVGPEGDFTSEEIGQAVSAGAHPITLGESRLRTETAGLIGLQWLHTLDMIHHTPNTKSTISTL